MITILHRGGGSPGTPKSDYVICARPLMLMLRNVLDDILVEILKLKVGINFEPEFWPRYQSRSLIKILK